MIDLTTEFTIALIKAFVILFVPWILAAVFLILLFFIIKKMNQKNLEKIRSNLIVFLLGAAAFCLFIFLKSGIILLFVILGPLLYGLFSRNRILSALFGALLPSIWILSYLFISVDEFKRAFMPYFFVIIVLSGLSGFFAGASFIENDDLLKFNYLAAIACTVATIFWILTGIN
ncbi:hypothetical protein MmiEs2_12370 [Methanimicrococcus stummii]|uniref:Uncharacterized protein n=1 Tax=Methanimicrococcus stummii TaxID=3028294 RepID=A0AA96VA57_9EURY|nr:hypothetical protein [Methanimicrococcus sp. Es2]WNY29023.1 hypothetical protein MmiEs2_12370 [Methanimicrococcus sp. Es2]